MLLSGKNLNEYKSKGDSVIKRKTLFGLIISAICLYFSFKGVDWRMVLQTISTIDKRILLLLMPLYGLAFIIRSVRWRYLLRDITRVSWKKLFPHLMIGFLLNNILPMRIGEFARAYSSGKKLNISKTASFSSIVLERTFDGMCFLACITASFYIMPFPEWVRNGAIAAAVFFISMMSALFFLAYRQDTAKMVFKKLPLPVKLKIRFDMITENFFLGLQSLRNIKTVAVVVLLSCVVWTIELSSFYLMSRAFHLDINIADVLFTAICVVLGVMVPAAPGYVGTYEFTGRTALGIVGVEANIAVSFILFLHFFQFFVIFVLGFPSLTAQGISLEELKKES